MAQLFGADDMGNEAMGIAIGRKSDRSGQGIRPRADGHRARGRAVGGAALGAMALALLGVMAVPQAARADMTVAATLQAASVVDASGEARAGALLDTLVDSPARLRVFLRAMPKGGDLHNHLSGSVYAEDYLAWAAQAGFCADKSDGQLSPPPCKAPAVPVKGLGASDPVGYGQVVDGLSMRGFTRGVGQDERTGHTQFFTTFGKFGPIANPRTGESLAELRRIAAGDHVSYVELMHNPDGLNGLAVQATGDLDASGFEAAYKATLPLLPAFLRDARANMDAAEARSAELLGCKGAHAAPGCDVTIYYLGYGLRTLAPAQVFRGLMLTFALADADPRFVGVNIVAPEDYPVAVADYDLHMEMFRFLEKKYPRVHRSLHAGELTLGLVPPEALRDHIRKAVEIGGAERIGHGVDISYETDAAGLLAEMAKKHIAVEINLTSNDGILGVKGREHPLPLYRAAGVPVALSTDDEGVSRSDMTHEYERGVEEQGLRYADLKGMARASLEYSFVPGASLWADRRIGEPVSACVSGMTPACKAFVAASPRATLQWQLEQDFSRFEHEIVNWRF